MVLHHLLQHVVCSPQLARMIVYDLSDGAAVSCPQRLPQPPSDSNHATHPYEEGQPGDDKAHVPRDFFFHCHHPSRINAMPALIAESLKQPINEMPRADRSQYAVAIAP